MNRQQLLSRLAARGWPVIYSNGPMSIWDRGTERWNAAPWFATTSQDDGVTVDHPGRIPSRWPTFPRWDRYVIRKQGRRLSQLGAQTGNNGGIAYLFHPQYASHLHGLRFHHLVYHAFDALALTPGWSDDLARKQRDLVQRADLLVGSSIPIIRDLPDDGPQRAHELPNGADAEAFSAAIDYPCPDDLAAIPNPRIGYVGRINRKVDFNLICEIANRNPDWHWVLVGPVQTGRPNGVDTDPLLGPAYNACRHLKNVHFLGSKSRAELPAYVAHMDVNTMCYRQEGGWWIRGYPLKMHEYLATGIPVVSARLETIRPFSHVITIAQSVDEWISGIGRSLSGEGAGSLEQRQAVAFEHTWDRCVDRLDAWLLEMVGSSA